MAKCKECGSVYRPMRIYRQENMFIIKEYECECKARSYVKVRGLKPHLRLIPCRFLNLYYVANMILNKAFCGK